MKSSELPLLMKMMKLSALMYIQQSITGNFVLKLMKVSGWPNICKSRSKPKDCYSQNPLLCASRVLILQERNLMVYLVLAIQQTREMMIFAHHSQRYLDRSTLLPIFFSLKILSKSQNRVWLKWLLIQSATNYVLNQTMVGVYLLSMYANLLQLKRNRV